MFKLSSEASLDGAITVENKFIVEYLPYADGDYVKVYLYGLSLASRKNDGDDSVERLARRLDLDITAVNAAIDYWSELGLMSRLGDDICYFSPRLARAKIKKYDVDKYTEFNRQAQLYIAARQISPNEFNEYYSLMEKLNLEWQAMVLIVKYCVNLKGDNVPCPYILAVARNLASDGYRTADDVGERLDEFGVYYAELKRVLAAMGGKTVDHDAVQLYKKWKKVFRFSPEVILHVAQTVKRGNAATLDAKLTAYNALGLTGAEQIDEYEITRKNLSSLAKSVNKALGLYYENVEPEIIAYIKPWLDMGFAPAAVLSVAEFCMKKDMRRLSDLDVVIRDLFSLGIIDEKDIKAHISSESRYDGEIARILKATGVLGAVKDIHRSYYKNWADKWGFSAEIIEYAASLATEKANPFAYINAILLAWHNGGVSTVEQAKAQGVKTEQTPPSGAVYQSYTEQELNSMFTQISEDE